MICPRDWGWMKQSEPNSIAWKELRTNYYWSDCTIYHLGSQDPNLYPNFVLVNSKGEMCGFSKEWITWGTVRRP